MLPDPAVTSASLAAVLLVAALVRWTMGDRRSALTGTAEVMHLAAQEIHGFAPVDAVIAADGWSALCRSRNGALALVFVAGDRRVARLLDPAADSLCVAAGALHLRFADLGMAPRRLPLSQQQLTLWQQHWQTAAHA